MHRHAEVYLDESGDLGFSEGRSRHFVVVAIATYEPVELRRLVKRVQRRRYPRVARPMGLKFNNSPNRVKRSMCAEVADSSVMIAWCGAAKRNIPGAVRNDKRRFYLGMCTRTLSDPSMHIRADPIHVVLDKWSGNRSIRRGIGDEIIRTLSDHHPGHFPPEVSVSHLDSHGSEGIQIADFVAGAVFQPLERSNDACRGIVGSRILCGRMCW